MAGPVVSVVIPAYNEEALLASTVRDLKAAFDALSVPVELTIVNDGSRDRTAEVADALAREIPGVNALHQANQGIGGAFRAGASRAQGEYILLWPADMPAVASDLEPYVGALGKADVIVGCRSRRLGYNLLMRVNAWIYPRLVGLLFGLHLRDVNWIHMYRRSAFSKITLTQSGIPMLVESLVRLRDLGASFREVDVAMKPRASGVASASRFRVMRRTLGGLFSFWLLWRRERRMAHV